jgi:hypothetical protein
MEERLKKLIVGKNKSYTAKMMKDYDKDTKKKSPKKKGPSGRKSPLGRI